MGAPLPPAARTPATPAVCGVLQLGPAQIALPLDALREVIPCPARFAVLPGSAIGLVGAVEVRGQVVPVLDLCAVLGWPDTGPAERVVVLMRQAVKTQDAGAPREHHLIGLVAHGVRGITAPAVLHAVDAPGGAAPLLFSASFVRAEDNTVVSVLDPAAVLRLPGLPALRTVAGPAAALPRAARARSHRPMMLVRCGPFQLAVDIADIHTTLPHVVVKTSSVGGGTCRGVLEHDGTELPAVDPLAVLGLGALPPEDRCQALLLRFESGFVALLVSEVVDIVAVGDDALLPLPAAALERPALFGALVHLPARGEHLVLARGALHADAGLRTLAGLNVRRAGRSASASGSAQATQASSVVVFDAGTELAAPLTDVQEIVPYPGACLRAASPNAAIVGLFSHQRRAVALVCLARLLGLPAVSPGPAARVLLVEDAGVLFGFIVARLYNIETPRWAQPGDKGTVAAQSRRFAGHPLIELGEGGQRRTLPLLDLPALVRRLSGAGCADAREQGGDAQAAPAPDRESVFAV